MPHHSPPTVRHNALRAYALALVVLALGACANSADNDPSDIPATEDPHLIGHVHGLLGIDPADGTLYAAGHFGVFRIDEDGIATRIADRWQDTMAFTVTGPGTFLASGHPDVRENLPPHLGLHNGGGHRVPLDVSAPSRVRYSSGRCRHGPVARPGSAPRSRCRCQPPRGRSRSQVALPEWRSVS